VGGDIKANYYCFLHGLALLRLPSLHAFPYPLAGAAVRWLSYRVLVFGVYVSVVAWAMHGQASPLVPVAAAAVEWIAALTALYNRF
jgi:hypothetical protein